MVVGLDANAANLREASSRVGRKSARGGLPNALFGRLSLDEAPGELAGLAREVTVLLPWGSLLEAVARPNQEPLSRLFALASPDSRFTFVFGYDRAADPTASQRGALPSLDEPEALAELERRYREAGVTAKARRVSAKQVGLWPTTWARKLAVAGQNRPFVEVNIALSSCDRTAPGPGQHAV